MQSNGQLIYADNESLNVWHQNDLTAAAAMFSRATQVADHHRLANLAVIRARLRQWDLAERDARLSIQIRPTVLGHIAAGIAVGGQGKLASAKQELNQAFLRDEPKSNCLLLLIKSIIIFMAGGRSEAMKRVKDLVDACEEANKLLLCRAAEAQMHLLFGQTALDGRDYENALKSFGEARALAPLSKSPELETISLIFGWDFDSLLLVAHQQTCETLYTASEVTEAVRSLRTLLNEFGEEARASAKLRDWLQDFILKCAKASETAGDAAVANGKYNVAIDHYSVALSIDPPSRADLIVKRNKARLVIGAWEDAKNDLDEAGASRFAVFRQISEALLEAGRLTEVITMLKNESPDDSGTHDERAEWELVFRERCVQELVRLGDAARDSQNHDEAIGHYSSALLLGPLNPDAILLKHSDELIERDPSSHKGYEEKYASLRGMGRYSEAFESFRMMLAILEQSPEPEIRELRHQYIDATSAIRKEVDAVVRKLPLVLIDTDTGHIYDRVQQTAAFEQLPLYDELRASMTAGLDESRIQREVVEFYRYVMLSHRWQPGEPTFKEVENTSIYELPESPAFSKLKSFCTLVRSLGFKWAWSDTCCIDRLHGRVQQESIVAMFKWYRRSSLTLVHLLGVLSESKEIGRLRRSIWNTRGWTCQEYVASKVVQFYTEDWKPYLGMDVSRGSSIYNHKESPVILEEMEQAMHLTTVELEMLQPGLDMIRKKLYLASMRQTTRVEDVAYSLFGIFGIKLPIIYGEGYQAVGRLLEHIVTRSADVTILAWTGRSGGSHSYFPADLTVYNQIEPPHIPPPVDAAAMDDMAVALRSSSFDLTLAEALYHRFHDLPPLLLVAGRLRLPAIVFPLHYLAPPVESDSDPDSLVYCGTTSILGNVEIKTTTDARFAFDPSLD